MSYQLKTFIQQTAELFVRVWSVEVHYIYLHQPIRLMVSVCFQIDTYPPIYYNIITLGLEFTYIYTKRSIKKYGRVKYTKQYVLSNNFLFQYHFTTLHETKNYFNYLPWLFLCVSVLISRFLVYSKLFLYFVRYWNVTLKL